MNDREELRQRLRARVKQAREKIPNRRKCELDIQSKRRNAVNTFHNMLKGMGHPAGELTYPEFLKMLRQESAAFQTLAKKMQDSAGALVALGEAVAAGADELNEEESKESKESKEEDCK